jgi:hypothetical protein
VQEGDNSSGPYTAAQAADIWRVLTQERVPRISQDEFKSAIQLHAEFFRALSIRLRPFDVPAPSTRAREMARLSKTLSDLHSSFPRLKPFGWKYHELYGAAEELADARHGVTPPGVTPRKRVFDSLPGQRSGDTSWYHIWPIETAFENALRHVEWLAAVAKRAGERQEQDKAEYGKKQEDDATYVFARQLDELYERVTGTDPRADKAHFVDFVVAAFAKLLPDMTAKACEAIVDRHFGRTS